MYLFVNKKEIIIFSLICLLIFGLNLLWQYNKFLLFKSTEICELNATLLNSEQKISKKGKKYYTNAFKTDDFRLYANSKFYIKSGDYTLRISTKNVKFSSYLKASIFTTFFSLEKIQKDKNTKSLIADFIQNQHKDKLLKNFFGALYLALPLSKELRGYVTNWGIAHLIAISGFHLSLLLGAFYFFTSWIYKKAQSLYFPYRNRNIDLGILAFILAGFYLYLLDFTPSYLRSYFMAVFGFIMLCRGIKVFSFTTLYVCLFIALCLNPALLFSLGFYFSCMGVFFIFVYIRHFGDAKVIKSPLLLALHSLGLNIFVFCAMNIPVYYFFSTASIFQLSVIPISYIFVIFYPISILLHLFSLGGIFDEYLLAFLHFASKGGDIYISSYVFYAFNLTSLLCIKYKSLALLLALLGLFVYIYGLFVSY